VSSLQAKPMTVGVVLILLGFATSLYGGRTYLRDVPRTVADTFQVGRDVKNGSFWAHDVRFEASTLVAGNGVVSSEIAGQASSIDFLVLDSANFENWRQRQPDVQYIVKMVQTQTKFNFSFATPRNDTYFFVFDNYYSAVKKNVLLNVRYQYVRIIKEPFTDYTATYVALVLAMVGTTALAYALLKKPEIRWA